MRRWLLALPFVLLFVLPAGSQSVIDTSDYQWVLISDEFDNPVFVTHAGDGSGRLFVVEQTGFVWVMSQEGMVQPEPFLDVSRQLPPAVSRGGYSEMGLLGLAFAPDFAVSGRLFIHYNDLNNDTVIARYIIASSDANLVDVSTAVSLLTVDQPFDNHKGGMMAFGLDGYLYIGLGDGGDQGDPYGYAQNTESLLGKVLRLDVSGERYTPPLDNPFRDNEAFAPEVWALGFRNPWRLSFDRATGDLYIADVGEWQREEINFQSADSAGGENYGWNLLEGDLVRDERPTPPRLVAPVAMYDHSAACAVAGGYVYRGAALPELNGVYFFGDYCTGRIWTLQRDESGAWTQNVFMETGRQITSFGEDEAGELYLVDYKGDILRLERAN